jgi:hypothetical protein
VIHHGFCVGAVGLSIAERAAGAIIGCCVADAAATPVQWIYDVQKLQQLLEQRQQVRVSWLVVLCAAEV